MINITELIEGMEILDPVTRDFHRNILENPESYSLMGLRTRTEIIEPGKTPIPRKGQKIFIDSDYWELQSRKWKRRYPELCRDGERYIVEEIQDVHPFGSEGQVEVVTRRYLIERNSNS